MAKPEEVLQKVTDYCTEKQYTLNDDFRSQFSEKFAKVNTDADINDENVLNSIKFNLDTAFSAASKELKIKDETWKNKESEYLKQIEALKKNPKVEETKVVELPEEIKKELGELTKFKEEKQKQEKRAKVLNIAKNKVREDLHSNLEEVLSIMQLDYSKTDEELAQQLDSNFTKIYTGKIGDIRPISSHSKETKDEDWLNGVKKVQIK